jgi:hypothetical protein
MKNHSRLKAEIRKQWRRHYAQQMQRRGEPLPAGFREQEPDDGELNPPDAPRVARRAACLAAVALRGLASTWGPKEQQEFAPRLRSWFDASGLQNEIEPKEAETIAAPASELDQRAALKACWRWEGAAVLVAALGRLPLPPHDQTVDTYRCGRACGVLAARDQLDQLIPSAALDPSFDCQACANRALAIHWRLRQFVQVEQKPLDFATFARGVQWADLDLTGVRLLEGDLAIVDAPIWRAPRERVQMALSIASERHIAANWLIGWHHIYSEVENPT